MNKGRVINILLLIISLAIVAFFARSVKLHAATDKVAVLDATGMTCGACAASIDKALSKLQGVEGISVDVEKGQVIVGFDSAKIQPERLARGVVDAGYVCNVSRVVAVAEYRKISGQASPGWDGGCGCCEKKSGKERI